MYQLVTKAGKPTGFVSSRAHPLTLEEWDIDYPSNAPHAWQSMHAWEVRDGRGNAVGLWPHPPTESQLQMMDAEAGRGPHTVHRVPV